MSYEERIREARAGMSKSFARLADYLLDAYLEAAMMTATELAHEVDVDAATVVRFAQHLGYSGFPELQDEIKDKVRRDLLLKTRQDAEPDSVSGVVRASLGYLADAIGQARKLLNADAVVELVEKIGDARRIILLPESLGQSTAYNLVALLEQGGFLVSAASPNVNDLARAVSTATRQDLLLAIDVSGEAPFIARALAEANELGISTAAIVGAPSYRTARSAKVVLAAPSQATAGVGIVVVDALVYTLAEALRWRYPDRFAGASEAIERLFDRIRVGG